MYICMKTYIYLRVDGEGCDPLPFPQNDLEQDKILTQVKEWVKTLRGFDSYDSDLTVMVIDGAGNILYRLATGHAYSVPERVLDAIWCVKSQATEETVA